MKLTNPETAQPSDADTRKAVPPVICYPPDSLAPPDLSALRTVREHATKIDEVTAAPRNAACCDVPAGAFFRISPIDGPQVGDLNLWSKDDLTERFYSGKTRALHGTHLSTGDRM